MPRIRRGGYIFLGWVGDHVPRHVHVYRDGKLVLKWNLERSVPMSGRASRRIVDLIHDLQREGRL